MNPDPTLRADLMAFLEAGARNGDRVRLSTPDYRPFCSATIDGQRCWNECDLPGQRYCATCRQRYQEIRQNKVRFDVLFHDDIEAALGAHDRLRRRTRHDTPLNGRKTLAVT